MESVYRFEDSGHEILSMELHNLCINRNNVMNYFNFRTNKMHGTISNHIGYAADAGYTNGCRVPHFIFDTLHNPNEKQQRNRSNKISYETCYR